MPPWGEEHGSTEAELWDCFVCEKGRCRAIFAYENNPPYLVNAASLSASAPTTVQEACSRPIL